MTERWRKSVQRRNSVKRRRISLKRRQMPDRRQSHRRVSFLAAVFKAALESANKLSAPIQPLASIQTLAIRAPVARSPPRGQPKTLYDDAFKREVVPFLSQTIHRGDIGTIKQELDAKIVQMGAFNQMYVDIARKGFPMLLSTPITVVNKMPAINMVNALSSYGDAAVTNNA